MTDLDPETLRVRLARSLAALDCIAVALEAYDASTEQLPQIVAELVKQRDAERRERDASVKHHKEHHDQTAELDRMLGTNVPIDEREAQAWRLNRIRHLQDLAAERARSREAYAVEVSTLTVLVEQALSAAGLPATSDDPLLFRLGVLVERLRAGRVTP